MTSSPDVNEYAARHYERLFGENGTYRLISPDEMQQDISTIPQQGIFSYTDDFINLSEVARDYPVMHEAPVNNIDELTALLRRVNGEKKSIALFLKKKNGQLEILPAKPEEMEVDEGYMLVYLGKEVEN